MIFTSKDFLETKGIDKKKIHFELFNTPGQKQSTGNKQRTTGDTGPKSKITVKLDEEVLISIFHSAAIQLSWMPHYNRRRPAFACKGGVCCTCKARLLEGEVMMDVHWGLEEEEIEEGYILTARVILNGKSSGGILMSNKSHRTTLLQNAKKQA
ncbi:MAG: 2Fe-2S iron-sulfur cluster-binding protein [Bacteroidota bacterium]